MRPPTAATATADTPLMPWWLWAVLIGLSWAAVYLAGCRWRPFAACLCCKGNGKHARADGKVWRKCRWCRGSGTRLRVGRRVWNRFARVRKKAGA